MIVCNKQDLASAMSPKEIEDKLKLNEICKDREWACMGCSAKTGDGVQEIMDWVLGASMRFEAGARIGAIASH